MDEEGKNLDRMQSKEQIPKNKKASFNSEIKLVCMAETNRN